ncbi:ABC transporter substrate-binding protein, partial [Paenibacillus flagellatus]|uniref:ABC transporter substrate-binding protein n=1 Tax=Paenibacillus flagellatus TaxID=2211139 RepID=UPI00130518EA
MKKRVVLPLTLLLAAGVLSACGGNGPEQTSPAAPAASTTAEAPKNVALKFAIWGNDTHKKMYEDMIARFREKNPHISVEIMIIPFADYQQKLSIMQASKTAPDVVWLAERMIPQFLTAGQLLDVTALKADAAFKFDDVYPSTLELLSKDGNIYGIPFSTPPAMIYYNKTLFKEKGLATPTELYKQGKWNYDEFLKAAKALTDSSKGVYGTNFVRNGWGNWPDALQSVFNAYGADFLSKDGAKLTLNSKEGEQALDVFSGMIFKDKVHPKPGDQTTFDTGKIAMQKELFSYMGKAKAIKDFEWDIAPLPAGPAGTGTTMGYAGVVGMKDSKNPKEALEFIKPEFRKRIRMRWRSSRSGSTTVNKWEWDQRNFETNIHMGITP